MELTEQQEKLFDFVKMKHGDQKRKYTNEPYHVHLYSVAKIVSEVNPGLIEIALCHDLFEDTQCDFTQLYNKMIEIGYELGFSYNVCTCVKELTDVFTHENYPYMKRVERKRNESDRLAKVSPRSQTVKYADIIDNTSTIVRYDPGFAKIYLPEKHYLLSVMTHGDWELYAKC